MVLMSAMKNIIGDIEVINSSRIYPLDAAQRCITLIGDSHTLKYRNRLFSLRGEAVLLTDGYYRGFSLNTWGNIVKNISFLSVLQRAGLIGSTGRQWQLEKNKYINEYKATGAKTVYSPAPVLFVGEIDIRTALKKNPALATDPRPFLTGLLSSYLQLWLWFKNSFEVNPYVHLLDPPTSKNGKFLAVNETLVDLLVMGAIFQEFNKMLTVEFGSETVIDYSRTVRDTTLPPDTYNLHPFFEGDGCHASPRVVPLTLAELALKKTFFTAL